MSAPGSTDNPAALPGSGLTTRASFLLRLKATDPAPREIAWQDFRDKYGPVIAGFARNMGALRQDIDDIIQDVMTGFFATSPTFAYDPHKGRFRGYLKVCTFRALRERLRQNAHFRSMDLERVPEDDLKVEQAWTVAWDQELLKRALEAVRGQHGSTRTFRAFELYALLGMPAEQVAGELEMNLDSVYKARQRITDMLRAAVRELDDDR